MSTCGFFLRVVFASIGSTCSSRCGWGGREHAHQLRPDGRERLRCRDALRHSAPCRRADASTGASVPRRRRRTHGLGATDVRLRNLDGFNSGSNAAVLVKTTKGARLGALEGECNGGRKRSTTTTIGPQPLLPVVRNCLGMRRPRPRTVRRSDRQAVPILRRRGTVTDLAELAAFLFVCKYAATGAAIWLQYGYDGFAFIISKEFSKALLEWKLGGEERREMENHRAGLVQIGKRGL